MANLSKGLTYFIGIFTLFIISILGIIAQVSWSVIFIRSISAALIVSSLTYATCFLIYNLVIKELAEPQNAVKFEYLADKDLRVMDNSNEEAEQSKNKNLQTEEHNSFITNPNDSEIEDIINQDPQKAADILRKMGFDE